MRLKIAIAIIVAMFVAMPFTHWAAWKMGRASDYQKITALLGVTENKNMRVGKHVFTKKGVFPIEYPKPEIVRNFLACSSSCHGRVI